MCASVAIGLVTLVDLKFLPARNTSSLLQKEIGSAKTSDVIDGGSFVDEKSGQELLRMDARIAEGMVHTWQKIKSQAFGPDHSLGKLPEVLDGDLLQIWLDRAAEIAQCGWIYDYTLLNMTIDTDSFSKWAACLGGSNCGRVCPPDRQFVQRTMTRK